MNPESRVVRMTAGHSMADSCRTPLTRLFRQSGGCFVCLAGRYGCNPLNGWW